MNEASQHDRSTAGHEPSAIRMRVVAWSGIGLAALIALSLVLIWQLMAVLSRDRAATTIVETEAPVRASQPSRLPDSPELDPDQSVALQDLRDRERALLDEYEWLDRPAGVARIPIARAMAIVSENGLPKTSGPTTPAGGSTQ